MSLTAAQLATLKTELTTDPLNLGYATPRAAGAMQSLADLLNATTGAGAATVQPPLIARDAFVAGIRPGLWALGTTATAVAGKYQLVLQSLFASVSDIANDASTQGFLSNAVADGVLTQAQVDAIIKRTGSRAEVLLGAGIVVAWQDVVAALKS